MSTIRCLYRDVAPDFPASAQHPDAVRYGPFAIAAGQVVYVDAIGGEPALDAILALLYPPAPPAPTPLEKLAAAGLTVADLRTLLGMPIA